MILSCMTLFDSFGVVTSRSLEARSPCLKVRQKLLKAELEQRLLTPDTQMVTGFVVNNYAHSAEIFSAPQSSNSGPETSPGTGTDPNTVLNPVNTGNMGGMVNQPQVLEGETFGPGIWVVRVKEKNAGFKQRVLIDNADKGSENFLASLAANERSSQPKLDC